MEEHLGAKENSQCNLERNPKTSQEEPTITFMKDGKENIKDSTAGPPARKKRRMGMCGLREKEQSLFLQTQKHENGKNEAEMVKREICIDAADLLVQKDILSPPPLPCSPQSIPVNSVTEQSDADMKLQSNHCEANNRTGTEVSITVQNGTTALYYPVCSAGKSCEAQRGTVIMPEPSGELKSDQPSEGLMEGHLGNLEPEECQGSTEGMTRVERKENIIGDAGTTAETDVYSSDTRPAGFSCDSVERCEAAVTASDQERENSCELDVEPAAGASAMNTEHTLTRDTTDPFGSGNLDYISDSQLNVLIEEEVMKREEDCGSSHCHEDATDLVCGLIKELSSLNQKVMATHKELENLRRSSKTSRSSIR
ncbi:hypothetical protein Q5P01_026274 [Channa striata]|uniref:Uncharacterized protein n=1 Tax=Channa striata TaxID=64152 RepID=A0AA88LKB9_CHASR|nr:hypothetical protein Q5P01_026274 [Channa striata]